MPDLSSGDPWARRPARRYERRRPDKTPLHKIASEHLESWLEWRDQAERPVPGYVEDELRGYLECGSSLLRLRPRGLHDVPHGTHRGMLADRPAAVNALTKIFLDEIKRTLITASGVTAAADTPSASRPRLGGISFLHRFGSALNHHVHLHACVTDGVFMPADEALAI